MQLDMNDMISIPLETQEWLHVQRQIRGPTGSCALRQECVSLVLEELPTVFNRFRFTIDPRSGLLRKKNEESISGWLEEFKI